jgi:GNAT superfamily N-acetyltransferase
MADMLVKLYDLPDLEPALAALREANVLIRAAAPSERATISAWVRQHFQASWAAGCETALTRDPPSLSIAVEIQPHESDPDTPYDQPAELLLGFAGYDAGVRGMFGPMGVREDYRNRGIGTALLLHNLHAMRRERYAYAVIGWAGPTDFYAKTVGATIIEGSAPGIFRGPLVPSLDDRQPTPT